MGHIERAWLRRIGEVEGPARPVRRRKPGADLALGEDPQGEEAAEADSSEDVPPAEPGQDQPQRGEPEQGEGSPADQNRSAEGEGRGDLRLSVPEEVEARRREEQRRDERTPRNRHLAHHAFSLEGKYLKGLAARFARMVSKVAEDSADLPTAGDDEWDLEELRMRRFTGRHVNQCRMTREKRKVAVVLDTSPSCAQQARLFGAVARVAEALGDCELYDAPNFAIVARKLDEPWETLPEMEQEWDFRRRVVLAFGDFDGIERISAASRRRGNKIYWFCCEERPSVLQDQREFFVKNYRGFYFPAPNLERLMVAMRRVR
jgi:hypothetical protein